MQSLTSRKFNILMKHMKKDDVFISTETCIDRVVGKMWSELPLGEEDEPDNIALLEICIAKYTWLLNNKTKTMITCGCDGCALCRQYHTTSSKRWCDDCPIRNKTGYSHCEGTPFLDLNLARMENDRGWYLSAIKKEVKFLKELRKELVDNGNTKH